MRKFTLTHEINCSVDHFWKVFFDKDFNTELFTKELGFPEYKIVEQSDNDGTVKRRIKGVPKMEMPKAVMKVLGDGFGYEENGQMNPNTKVWTWKMTPSTLANKLRNEGTVRCEPMGDNKCKRIAVIECEAKIFGVGGVIESSTEKEFRRGWDQSAVFMNNWIKNHPPG